MLKQINYIISIFLVMGITNSCHPMKRTLLYIVRHGETNWNKSPKKVQGHTDIPLNDTGLQQAAELRDFLQEQKIHFAHCVSSDLLRAVETAKIVYEGQNSIVCDKNLRERYAGSFEGCLWSDYIKVTSQEKFGIEQDDSMRKRVFCVLDDLGERFSNSNTLVVTHGGVIKIILTKLLNLSQDYEISVKNAAILTIACNEDRLWHVAGLQGIQLKLESNKGTDTFSIKK
jgi:broad specificity phosphatase PhoE